MKVVFRRCCGVDIQEDTVLACGLIQDNDQVHKDLRSFPLTPTGLLDLLDRLWAWKVTHVAMNGTGDRWKPAFYLFEGSFTVFLVDPVRLQSVLGRPEGMPDCAWLADLLSCGLLKGTLIAPEPVAELRDLLRYRRSLVEERSVEMARFRKILEAAQVGLPPSLLEGEGFSILALLEALFGGTAEPGTLAELARGRLRDQLPGLRQVVQKSIFPPYHRFMLEQILMHLDLLHEALRQMNEEVKNRIVPFGGGIETSGRRSEEKPRRGEALRGRVLRRSGFQWRSYFRIRERGCRVHFRKGRRERAPGPYPLWFGSWPRCSWSFCWENYSSDCYSPDSAPKNPSTCVRGG